MSAYCGRPDCIITIGAIDDVKVKTVGVMIVNDDGTLVEKGTAVLDAKNANQWLYTTRADASSTSVKVVVDVADIAGPVAEVYRTVWSFLVLAPQKACVPIRCDDSETGGSMTRQ